MLPRLRRLAGLRPAPPHQSHSTIAHSGPQMTRKNRSRAFRRDRSEYVELLLYLAILTAFSLPPILDYSATVTALVASTLLVAALSARAAVRLYRRRPSLSVRETLGPRLTHEDIAVIRSWSLLGTQANAINRICLLFPELSARQAQLLLQELIFTN